MLTARTFTLYKDEGYYHYEQDAHSGIFSYWNEATYTLIICQRQDRFMG